MINTFKRILVIVANLIWHRDPMCQDATSWITGLYCNFSTFSTFCLHLSSQITVPVWKIESIFCKLPHQKAPEFPEIGVFWHFACRQLSKIRENRRGRLYGFDQAKGQQPIRVLPTQQRNAFLFSHAKDGADGLVRGLKTAGVPPENLRQFGSCEKMENFAWVHEWKTYQQE